MIDEVSCELGKLSSPLNLKSESFTIILAAGHGKRIKSQTPKMLHKIWGIPTVLRVSNAIKEGLRNSNQIIVVGMKALEVAQALGEKRENTLFVYQEEQKGTGHAVQVALKALGKQEFSGDIYIFPGDMGLVTPKSISNFKKDFEKSKYDMMILTGIYQGEPPENYYGRIIRVPEGEKEAGKVIEIKEKRDILNLQGDYEIKFKGKKYRFSQKELLNINEFNAGVYAFRGDKLQKYIKKITSNNVPNEIYLPDIVNIFNNNSLSVGAVIIKDNSEVLAFNNKSVLKQMDELARARVYNKLKDIITFKDREDFFIDERVMEKILQLDKGGKPLDITIGKGVHISEGIILNRGITIKKNVYLEGNIILGENVTIWDSVHLSTYPQQTLKIGKNSEILQGDIVKGNLEIGENTRIESSVNVTGSDEYPTRIGNNVLIKGTSYIFGSIIEDDLWIEHSVLKKKYVEKVVKKDGTVQPIRYVLPLPEGIDSLRDL